MQRVDLVVVGGGIMGTCTAAALAVRDRDVLVLERSPLIQPTGSSRGTARFRQLENHPDASYLDLGVRARRLWGPFERAADRPIFYPTGNLSFGHPHALAAFSSALRERGLACEEVFGSEIHARWSALRDRSDDVLFQPDGEVIAADVGHAAALRVAEGCGVKVRRGVAPTAISPVRSGIEVRLEEDAILARYVILAAGPWIAPLARAVGIDLPVEVTRQTVTWFAWRGGAPPTVTDWTGREPYLLWDPGGGLKAAEHHRGPVADPDDPGEPDPSSVDRLRVWIDETFARPLAGPLAIETCLYTNAPEDRFVIECKSDVIVVSACSGHGYQYAPAVAEDVADVLGDA